MVISFMLMRKKHNSQFISAMEAMSLFPKE